MKTYNLREIKSILKDNGFIYDHQTGDHLVYKRDNQHLTITAKPNKMVWQRLVKEYSLCL